VLSGLLELAYKYRGMKGDDKERKGDGYSLLNHKAVGESYQNVLVPSREA
jgi:hypothetical protein